jgi:serine/threonine protein kinase
VSNEFPDFSNYGYQVTRELGHNRAGGRVTYLATEINTQQQVVVKQFQFARSGASWSEFQAYEREILVLKGLDNPSIPRYLDSFQTAAGFCMVQEYKDAPSLLVRRRWKPQEIKQIAMSVLDILKYLQNRIPPVLHRDLKPDNILVDRQMNVYLVDFGFARTGGGEVAASSVVKGTLGFMPPEQLFNRQLTTASDLYSLGATLICLLTGTASTEVGSLMDDAGRIHFKQRVSHLSAEFVNWLQKMAEPNFKNRYASAAEAQDALIPLDVLRPPELPKFAVPAFLGLVAIGAVTLAAVTYNKQVVQLGETQQPSQLAPNPQLAPNSQVLFTSALNSTNNLDTISVKENGVVYFYVSFSPLENREYDSVCRILDGAQREVYTGRANLRASGSRLTTWCWYYFHRGVDKPGEWVFEFSLDGQNIVQKHLTVLP